MNFSTPTNPGNPQEPAELEQYVLIDSDDVAEFKRAGLNAVLWCESSPPYLTRHCAVTVVSREDEDGRRDAEVAAAKCRSRGVDARFKVLKGLGTTYRNIREWLAAGNDLWTALEDAGPPAQGNTKTAGTGKPRRGRRMGGALEQLAAQEDALTVGAMGDLIDSGTPTTDGRGRGGNQIDGLLELAANAELFHSPDMKAFAKVSVPENTETGVAAHHEILDIKSSRLRFWLLAAYLRKTGKAVSGEVLTMAILTLQAKAICEGKERAVFIRVGADGDRHYLDLCDPAWRVVELEAGSWKIIDQSPVAFRRSNGTLLLPAPIPGGSFSLLRQYVNVAGDDDFKLLIVWLLACLRSTGPYPLLILHGEQGSAKSTTSRVLRRLIDPHCTPLQSEPRSARDLMALANLTWMLAFDNLSGIQSWLSDALCRLATGGGFSTRELYTNDEVVYFNAMRPILLNGIDDVAERPDLLDRAILLRLPAIADNNRQEESVFWSKFEADLGPLLGALLDAFAGAMKLLPDIELDRLPRMADFARFGESVGRFLGWGDGTFMTAYTANIEGATASAAEASPFVRAIEELMAKQEGGVWSGTSADLLLELRTKVSEQEIRGRNWPDSAQKISNALTRFAPILRSLDIYVVRSKTRSNKGRKITISKGQHPALHAAQAEVSLVSQLSLPLENKEFSSDGTGDGQVTIHPGAYPTVTEQSPNGRRGKHFNSNGLHDPSDGSDGSDCINGTSQAHAVDGKAAGRKRVTI